MSHEKSYFGTKLAAGTLLAMGAAANVVTYFPEQTAEVVVQAWPNKAPSAETAQKWRTNIAGTFDEHSTELAIASVAMPLGAVAGFGSVALKRRRS